MLGGGDQPSCTPRFPELPPMAFSGVGTGRGPREAPVTYGSMYLCPNLEE